MAEQHGQKASTAGRLRDAYVRTGRLPLGQAIALGLMGLFVAPIWAPIKHLPGVVGMKLRQWIYRLLLKGLGPRSLIDVGVEIPYPRQVRIGSFTLIDKYCQLTAPEGGIEIGDRCHLAPFTLVLGHGEVRIGDYVGIAAGARIYSISEWPGDGKRLAGPMVPQADRGFKLAPVAIGQDAFVGANAVILPGVTVGEGAVVGANAVVVRDVEPWTVVMGNPAMPVGRRDPVTV